MDKTALVGMDLEKGSRVLEILDAAGLEVHVALWAFLDDYEDWRFVLSSRKFDAADIRKAYGLYHAALEKAGMDYEETPFTMILGPNDLFIRALRKKFGKDKRVEGTRIYSQRFGDRFAQQGYVYRA
jgi:hypothetical protein